MKMSQTARIFLFAFFAFAAVAGAQRLPDTVLPERYQLTLAPDLKAAIFRGREEIDVTLGEPSNSITLNAAELEFKSVFVTAGGKRMSAEIALDSAKEQATFTFSEKLPKGKAKLEIQYNGVLNNELRGFYLSKAGKRNYAVTQFESTDARRAFPSFDEPARKAVFDLTLEIDVGDTAIANTPIVSDTFGPVAGKHIVKFQTTPKMSTYLVAILVGDFQCSSGRQDGVNIRVCSTPDKVALTRFGVDEAKLYLHYYNNYFGIPYPLKKLDLVALPDFEAGAMENFGAITYRETALLVDPKTASYDAKREVALVIAHEMAHQWFGDLVTMRWWDNLWLNEGFATWMEMKAVAALHPEWKLDEMSAVQLESTLNLDAMPTTHAIRAKAETPAEINQMFDGISYGKAAAVLASVENYLGEESFRRGVHAYLKAHLYGNATAEDFWGALTKESRKPADRIMGSFVAQPGEPLLVFGEPANGRIPVEQSRFFLSPAITPDSTQKWALPVCFRLDAGRQSCELLTPEMNSLPAPKDAAALLANARAKGFYRVAYPHAVFAKLAEQAKAESGMSAPERINLLGGEWAQVRANQASVGDFLDLAAAMKSDPSADLAELSLARFGNIYERIAATEQERMALFLWLERNFAPELVKINIPGRSDSNQMRQRRAQIFGALGAYAQDKDVLAQAAQWAGKYLDNPAATDAELGQTSLALAARNGDQALFERLQSLYESSSDPEQKTLALHLLATFENPALLERALEYIVSEKVRNQDAGYALGGALSSARNRDQAWKFIQTHWPQVQAQLTVSSGARLVAAADGFCTVARRDEVKSFFTEHQVPASDQALTHALESIDGCVELRALQEPKLKEWAAKLGE